MRVVGKRVPRIDGLRRVSGKATYTGDHRLPGMLYARVLRSPHPHARIVSIDVSAARELAGVKAVITRENCEVVWSGGDSRNRRYLFNNPVRFVGEAVAAVAAENRHLAEEALGLIRVDYEPLDFVLDPEEALKPGAVPIQPGGNLSPDDSGARQPEVYRRGDIAAGLADSDLVFEETYETKHVNNAQMEPRVSVARWQGDHLTVWASTQGISFCRRDLARDLGLSPDNVRVICQYMGGGFGNKNNCHDFDLMAAVLSRKTGAPVKLEFTRTEDFIAVHGRWPTRQYYKVGVKKDGTLNAIQLRGYSGMGPYRKRSGQIEGVEFFRCPHVEVSVYPVYTNMAVGSNYRAPRHPHGVFGIESVLDQIAHELRINPLDFHLKNVSRKYHDRYPYTSYGLKECLLQGAERFEWRRRWRRAGSDRGPLKRGLGMAILAFPSRAGQSGAVVRMNGEGDVWVHVGVTDVGTGAKTTMAILAAEALGVELEKIKIVSGDTSRCPFSIGESGSRTTNYTGQAVLLAVQDLQRQIEEKGPPGGDDVYVGLCRPKPISGSDWLVEESDGIRARKSFAAHFVEIEVDLDVGALKILRYLAVHDSGRIINRLTAENQVRGGVIQGLGMALHEELLYDQNTGIPLNPGFYGAHLMTHLDAPEIEVRFVQTEDPYGPYGAKSLGENPIVPTVAAVSNALFNATGGRIRELPMTIDRILALGS